MQYVILNTNHGNIEIELNDTDAPQSVANFIQYVKSGHYDGTIFHRVIKDFMIQGGGFDATLNQKTTTEPIKNEANNGLKNNKYTIAMARTQDPHSASSQFFINVQNNSFLDFSAESPQGWGYAVFGCVTQGTDIVDKIAHVKTGKSGHYDDVPLDTVTIINATMK